MAEKKKESYKQCYEKSCQIPLGQALSADSILRTTLTHIGGVYVVSAELVDLEKQAGMGAAVEECEGEPKKHRDRRLMQAVKSLVAGLPRPGADGRLVPVEQVPASSARPGREARGGHASVTAGAVAQPEGTTDLRGKAGVEWARFRGGDLRMGSSQGKADEEPVHRVTLSAFDTARTETTVAQFRACVEARGCEVPRHRQEHRGWKARCNWGGRDREQHPMNCVDFGRAKAFCEWVGGRLPTEAEWEYAASNAGGQSRYPWGDEPATCASAVMDEGRGNGCGKDRTWPVCGKAAGSSARGLCDMAGNVWEWVWDWYDKAYYARSPLRDPRGPDRGSRNVLRGGSFVDRAASLRVTARNRYRPADATVGVGFRCARSVAGGSGAVLR